MLNEERVILMTKLASYEARDGKKNISIGNYFRSDYISLQLIKSVICATFAFGLMFGLYVLYDIENFMQEVYKMDLIQFAKNILVLYVIFVVAYGVISYLIYTYKYKKAKRSLKCYYNNLKKLSGKYDRDGRTERI